MVVLAHNNPNIQEVEVRVPRVQGQHQLRSKFKASLSYMRYF